MSIVNRLARDNGLPTECIGVQFADDRDFVCVDCIKFGDSVNESDDTTVMQGDGWFPGALCTRCRKQCHAGR